MNPALFRWAGWLAIALIALLSLVPGEERPHTGLSGQIEHVLAYAMTGGVLALGYGVRRGWRLVLALSTYAGLLEMAQRWVPGRTGQAVDWLAGTGGSALGLAVAVALTAVARRANRNP